MNTRSQHTTVIYVVRIYAIAERDGLDYNPAYIPLSFKAKHREDFDTAYMR